MKKIVILVTLAISLGVGIFIISKSFSAESSPTPQPASAANPYFNLPKIKWEDQEYQVAQVAVENADLLQLIPNFQEKLSATAAKDKYECQSLVSGGFYLTDGSPAGLFIQGGATIKKWTANRLFNGVLSINDIATPRITFEVPRDHLRLAVQSGPVLIENGHALGLDLVSDKPARRVLAVVTGDNRLYFLVIFSPEQVFDGPKLTDLGAILSEIEKATGLVFADAINLDGGSASAFITSEFTLIEVSPVGSFFCLN